MSGAHSYGKGVGGFDRTFGLPMRQFVPTLLRLARLSAGQRVLDVATGTGIAAEAALDAVGPPGSVSARARPDGASCRTSSGYAALRIASAAVAQRR
jgi:predicted methyltransferase